MTITGCPRHRWSTAFRNSNASDSEWPGDTSTWTVSKLSMSTAAYRAHPRFRLPRWFRRLPPSRGSQALVRTGAQTDDTTGAQPRAIARLPVRHGDTTGRRGTETPLQRAGRSAYPHVKIFLARVPTPSRGQASSEHPSDCSAASSFTLRLIPFTPSTIDDECYRPIHVVSGYKTIINAVTEYSPGFTLLILVVCL